MTDIYEADEQRVREALYREVYKERYGVYPREYPQGL